MTTTLVFVGFTGDGHIYVNISPEEAIRKYRETYDWPDSIEFVSVATLEDGEYVGAYDMYGEKTDVPACD